MKLFKYYLFLLIVSSHDFRWDQNLSVLNLSWCEKPKKGWDPLQKKNTNMYLCDVMKYPKPGHLELVFYGALSCWKLSLIAAHFAQSETNGIQFWIWINFLNWCTVTKLFPVAKRVRSYSKWEYNYVIYIQMLIHWNLLILRWIIFYKTWLLIVSVEGS